MKKKINTIIYGYRPSEFMPIYRDGELDNRNQFIAYKVRKLAGRIAVLQ